MEKQRNIKEAVLWHSEKEDKVRCELCSFRCLISPGKLGNCAVRQNIGGKLYSLNYYSVCSAGVDPIEKKPLYHFLPGSGSFSIACPGCNFKCDFCQNWQISQMAQSGGSLEGSAYSPEAIIRAAIDSHCRSVAYTYTEPTIFMELASECGQLARKKGLKNIFVSNGYMTKEAVDFSRGWLDAINVDLKAFSENYYRRLCKATLKPVLETIEYIARNTDIWMEITTLIVPGENDSPEELMRIAEFIANLSDGEIPWHISRFYPNYKMDGIDATPGQTIMNAYEIAKSAGLKYVYIGNLATSIGQNTACPSCGEILIERSGYKILKNSVKNGFCPKCNKKISGFFEKNKNF